MPEKIKIKLKEDGFSPMRIRREEDFFEILKSNIIAIIDGYQFDESFYATVKKKCKVISIQDIYTFSDNVDLVLNHLPNSEVHYKNVEILSGPKYAILRPEFFEHKSTSTTDNSVFISLGGTINFSIINKMINDLSGDNHINVLTTEENASKIKGKMVNIFYDLNAQEVVKLIDQSNTCFVTTGMVSYEVLARNKKAIVGSLNDGQDTIGKEFKNLGLIEYVGRWEHINEKKIKTAMEFKNIDLNKVSNIFDGKSGERILKRFLQL